MCKDIFFLFFIFLFTPFFCFAQQKNEIVVIDNVNNLIASSVKVYILEDKSKKMTIDDILKPDNQSKFQKNKSEILNCPPSNSYYWLKISVQNNTDEKIWLDINNHFTWVIHYYNIPTNEKTYNKIIETGLILPNKTRMYPFSNTFWFPLYRQKSEVETMYFRINGDTGITVPIYVGTLAKLHQNKNNNDYIFGGFMGLVFIMLGYNLFLYFVTRDNVYLVYCVYLFLNLFVIPYLSCNYQIIAYVLPENWSYFITRYFFLWHNLIFAAIIIFVNRFLDMKKRLPTFYKYLMFHFMFLVFFIPLSDLFYIFDFYIIFLVFQLDVLVLYLSLLGVGIYLWLFKKDYTAFLYTVAWFWVIFFTFVFLSYVNGSAPHNFFTQNATILGAGLEILFFSLALGYRINVMRKEKENAQLENIKLVQEQNVVLEIKVKERTIELNEANEEINQTNEELRITIETVANQRDDILSSINYAKRIQTALLPNIERIQKTFPEFMLLYLPKNIVSGDFYWFSEIDEKNIVFLAVADCTGHGVSGAFMTIIGEALLEQIINVDDIQEPAKILQELDIRLLKTLKQGTNDIEKINDGMDVSILKFDLTNQKIIFAAAKRNLWIIEQNTKIIQEYKGNKFPIGSSQYKEKLYTQQEIKIKKGDVIYSFTDGYADQFSIEGKFRISKLRTIIQENNQKTITEQHDIFLKKHEDWKGSLEQTDDILLIGIKI